MLGGGDKNQGNQIKAINQFFVVLGISMAKLSFIEK